MSPKPKRKPKTTKPITTSHNEVGRPRPVKFDDPYQLRMTREDREVWTAHATRAGMTLAQWIRFQCAHAAGGTAASVSIEFKVTYPPIAGADELDLTADDGDRP